MKILITICLCLLLTNIKSADQGDWVDPFQLPIDFLVHPFYAGYLNLMYGQSFYYHYFPSQHNPDKDPLIVRISAGPGCSALYSAYYSKGPFIFVKNTKQFRVNPHNWNKNANVLFIEGPSGVGFNKGIDTKYQDQRAANQYYFALLRFYEKFPQLKDQQLYLSGQQYAGITVPRIAELITKQNRNPDTPAWLKIKLAGFILNNPCTLGDQCDSHFQFTSFTMKYLKNHYFISDEQYQQYKNHCTLQGTQCQKVKHDIQSHFMNTGADLRNIYNQCVNQQGQSPCFDQMGIVSFLNNQTVKKTLNADPSIVWRRCNTDIQKAWQRDPFGSFKIYQKLIKEQHDLRIWIVSGTLSGQVPITGTKQWFETLKSDLGLPMIRMWQPWYYNHTINAGDVQELRGITFASVRSGGYDLWNDQPEIGYYVIESFLKGTPL